MILAVIFYLSMFMVITIIAKRLDIFDITAPIFSNRYNMVGCKRNLWFFFATAKACVIVKFLEFSPFLCGITATITQFLRPMFCRILFILIRIVNLLMLQLTCFAELLLKDYYARFTIGRKTIWSIFSFARIIFSKRLFKFALTTSSKHRNNLTWHWKLRISVMFANFLAAFFTMRSYTLLSLKWIFVKFTIGFILLAPRTSFHNTAFNELQYG